jgi:IS30 family transposase
MGSTCRLHRYYYSADTAQSVAKGRLVEAREGIDCTPEDLAKTEALVKEGLAKGQGINHIFLAHAGKLAFSKSSFYRHVKNGKLAIIPLNLPKAVKYKLREKAEKPSRSNIAPEVLKGRTYDDFMELPEDLKGQVVECDCVEGPKEENDALLTLHFKALHFQIALKLARKDSSQVLGCFEQLHALLKDDFKKYFGILKFDRGCEFANVVAIEALGGKGAVRAYFTDSSRPDQKGSAEKNHVEIRKVIKKGASLGVIGMWELSYVMSHVNSSLRYSLFGKSPMELALGILPGELFDHLGYSLIAPSDVVLTPQLLDSITRPSQ